MDARTEEELRARVRQDLEPGEWVHWIGRPGRIFQANAALVALFLLGWTGPMVFQSIRRR